MAKAKNTKKKPKLRTKSAIADESFYHQIKAGGDNGWNEQYIDPKDSAKGLERVYLKYYGACIASVELVRDKGENKCKITIFGSPDKSPVPSEREISNAEWGELYDGVMEAIQGLYQL